jgi:hypothetical protein
MVHDGFSFVGQAPPDGPRYHVIFDFRHRYLAKNPLHLINLALTCSEVKRPAPVELPDYGSRLCIQPLVSNTSSCGA